MSFSTGKATTKNVMWAYLTFFSTKVLNLVAIVIIARYVTPAEFGTMAICLAVMGYFQIIARFGLGAALISAKDDVEETANAVFYTAMVMSSTMALILWSASEAFATWFGAPELEPLLGLLALALVVIAAGAVSNSFLLKELRHKDKVIPEVTGGLVKGGVSIALAMMGYGVWALAIGYLAGSLASTIALIWMRPWRPGAVPPLATVIRVAKYGGNLIGAETINSTPNLLDNILVGKFFGPAALGIYALAFRIPEMGIKTFTRVASTVIHPVMSKIQDDKAGLRVYFYQSLQYCAVLMFGVGAAIAVLSDPLVRVLYTPTWYEMILPMQLIAIAFSIGTLSMVPGSFLKAVNRTDLLFKVSLINLPMFLIVLFVTVQFNIVVVAAGQVVLSILRFIPTYLVMQRIADLTNADTLRALFPAAVCSCAAAVVTMISLQLLHAPELVRLLVGVGIYGATFLTLLYLLMPEPFMVVSKMISRRLRTS